MKTLIRKTMSGSEYWDNEEKRTLFVPAGKEPDFEVTENPGSMIMGVHLASGPDYTLNDAAESMIKLGKVADHEVNLDGMNVEQLLEFAEVNGIEVPGNMKKEETIQKYIAEQLAADDAE